MNIFKKMTELKKIINLIQSPWFKILCKKYINPLKDVKHDKKPLKITFSWKESNLFAIKKPKHNDPMIETIRLLFKNTLKKVAE